MSLFDKLNQHKNDRLQAEKDAGKEFLGENAKKEGIHELPNGIQYQVITEGSGPKPSPGAMIKAHYVGRLLNGKEFDNSYKRGQPFSARLTQLIQGWQQVIPMMPTGSRWRLWIPSDLAYGDRGAGGSIPGGATLDFEIELLEIL